MATSKFRNTKSPSSKSPSKAPKEFAAIGEKVQFHGQRELLFRRAGHECRRALLRLQTTLLPLVVGQRCEDEFDDAAGPDNEGGDEEDYGYYGTDLVTEGEGTLNSRGECVCRFRSACA